MVTKLEEAVAKTDDDGELSFAGECLSDYLLGAVRRFDLGLEIMPRHLATRHLLAVIPSLFA